MLTDLGRFYVQISVSILGLNKADTVAKYGEEQVNIWRRSFDVPPPPITPENSYYSAIIDDPIYAGELSKDQFPLFESLKLTIERTLPFWNEKIVPEIKAGKKILIAAHGNSLRGTKINRIWNNCKS